MTDPETPRTLRLSGTFELDGGAVLEGVEIAYRTWGRLDDAGSNAILVCHALTGSADADDWWTGLFGAGRTFDPEQHFIVCSNALGSCYGTTGPTSPHPDTGSPWSADFPAVTVRDMVRLQGRLLDVLGVRRLRLVIGGSMGGMQALEWPLLFPERIDAVVAVATSARHSAWCIGISESQRQAIYADPAWRDGRYPADDPPRAGLAAARSMAMLSYRSWQSLEERFGRSPRGSDGFQVEGYLRHQGAKLVDRFDANAYVTLTRAMDRHDVGADRGGAERALAAVAAPVLVVSIDSDVLYPPVEQRQLVRWLPHGELARLDSIHGHDGFLIDTEPLDALVAGFLDRRRAVA
ncbi:MAG: homoserine O-acetyltransferase [Acidobacteriota bacterium]